MGKIALLVSREEMLYQAHNILQEKKYEIEEMKAIRTQEAVSEARQMISKGVSIIIARGLQALLIKRHTKIPVVEIMITAQDMALLVMRAKQILKKNVPVIGVVGFKNMFCDMSHFDKIFDIDLRTYYAEKENELEQTSKKAVHDGVDLIIGGDTAVGVAESAGLPSLFLSLTEDSLRNAFSMAERMDYAMGTKKKNDAQMETLLDNSFHGVVRIGPSGKIADINPIIQDILQKKKEEVAGKEAENIFPDLKGEGLKQVLKGEMPSYSLFMQMNGISVFAMIAPVMIDERPEGAILTCYRMKRSQIVVEKSTNRPHPTAGMSMGKFEYLIQKSKAMQECVRLAKLFALSEKPVTIIGEAGTEKRLLAQCIHQAGERAAGPFIGFFCDKNRGAVQSEQIFGEKGVIEQARGGTLLLEEIGGLSHIDQYFLYQSIQYKKRKEDLVLFPKINVRVIITTKHSLYTLMKRGILIEELYYILEGLAVRIPSLRERPEDLKWKIDSCVKGCCDKYARFHVLTQGAQRAMMKYPWKGNMLQVETFCERLILTANKRSLDELIVNSLLKELYPEENENQDGWKREGKQLPQEAVKIQDMLEKMGGNRQKTATALNISQTTLWRKMKKYELI